MGSIEGGPGRALVITAALMREARDARPGDVPGPSPAPLARSAVIDGEVRGVDVGRGRLRVRTARQGTHTLRMDRSTRVFYRRVEYTLEALEPGDVVRVFVATDGSGTAWADRVDVRVSVDERRDHPDGKARPRAHEWLDGTVLRMDPEEGWFTVGLERDPTRAGGESEVTVYVPDDLDRPDESRLGQLRRGERVWIEVRPITDEEAELVRFRG